MLPYLVVCGPGHLQGDPSEGGPHFPGGFLREEAPSSREPEPWDTAADPSSALPAG